MQMRIGSLVEDAALANNYRGLSVLAAQWVKDNGYDPVTQGLYYGRIYGACEDPLTAPATPTFQFRNVGCSYGTASSSIRAARVLTAEGSNALTNLYSANPTPKNKTWADTAYGSIWGYGPYAASEVDSDDY